MDTPNSRRLARRNARLKPLRLEQHGSRSVSSKIIDEAIALFEDAKPAANGSSPLVSPHYSPSPSPSPSNSSFLLSSSPRHPLSPISINKRDRSLRSASVASRVEAASRNRSLDFGPSLHISHIEHLEARLAEATERLDSYYGSNSPRAKRIASLNAENRQMRAELNEWNESFEKRLEDRAAHGRAQMKSVEQKLKSSENAREEALHALRDLAAVNARLESELELTRSRISNIEQQDMRYRRHSIISNSTMDQIPPLNASVDDEAYETDISSPLRSKRSSWDAKQYSAYGCVPTAAALKSHVGSTPGQRRSIQLPLSLDTNLFEHEMSHSRNSSTNVFEFPGGSVLTTPVVSPRRMRRFSGGSPGPKPLLLPAVSVPPTPGALRSAATQRSLFDELSSLASAEREYYERPVRYEIPQPSAGPTIFMPFFLWQHEATLRGLWRGLKWYLIGFLLGPLAQRRLLTAPIAD